jgi:hypothetical protein
VYCFVRVCNHSFYNFVCLQLKIELESIATKQAAEIQSLNVALADSAIQLSNSVTEGKLLAEALEKQDLGLNKSENKVRQLLENNRSLQEDVDAAKQVFFLSFHKNMIVFYLVGCIPTRTHCE